MYPALALAALVFLLGHFALSAPPVRDRLTGTVGEYPFLGFYSLLALASFAAMLWAYGQAPFVPLWERAAWARWLALLVTPFAFILVVASYTSRNPTALFQSSGIGGRAPGILSITRHPAMWGVALWAFAHLIAAGDAASLILFGALVVLALGGAAHQDSRKARRLGAAWQAFASVTSYLPFAAILQGRTRLDWRGIGWWRVALGLAAWALFLHFHPALFGVAPLP
jgi:uncharacterized membrane protein